VVGRFDKETFGPRLVADETGRGSVSWLMLGGTSSLLSAARLSAEGTLSPSAPIAEGPRAPNFFEAALDREGNTFFLIGSGGNGERSSALDLYLWPPEATKATVESVVSDAQVSWASVLPSSTSPLVLWSETARGEVAELWLRPTVQGALGVPQRVAPSATAWQAKNVGVGVGLVFAPGPGEVASLELLEINSSGQVIQRRQLGEELPQVADIDFIRDGAETLVVFTGLTDAGPRLFFLRMDLTTGVASPARLVTRERGAQRLRQILFDAEAKRTFVVWEEARQDADSKRQILIGELKRERWTEPTWSLQEPIKESLLPIISIHKGGIAGIKHRSAGTGLEWFRLGSTKDALVQTLELPGLISSPELAWDLHCVSSRCFALSAASPQELTVFLTHGAAFSSFVTTEPQDGGLRAALGSDELIHSLPSLAALNAVPLPSPNQWLVASLTDFDPRLEAVHPERVAKGASPERAHLALQTLSLSSEANSEGPERLSRLGGEAKVSVRARSAGGLALSPLGPNGGLLAWAALDRGQPHVFLTSLDKEGRKVRQVMVQQRRGEIGDIAIGAVPSGFIVAWVDRSELGASLLLARTEDGLPRAPKPTPLGALVFTPSQLILHTEPSKLVLYYVAELEELSELVVDRRVGIFAVAIDPEHAEFLGEPKLLYETNNNLHTLTVLEDGDTSRLVWLEAGAGSSLDQTAHLWGAALPEWGKRITKPLELDQGVVSFGARCAEGSCRLATVKRVGGQDAIFVRQAPFEELPSRMSTRLLYLSGFVPPSTPPIFLGDTLLYPMAVSEGRLELRALRVDFAAIAGGAAQN